MPPFASLSARRGHLLTVTLVAVWLLLLLLAVASPALLASPTLGEDRVRYTIRVALLFYGLAAALMLALDSSNWQQFSAAVRLARWLWSLALVAYLIHVGMAFHYYHHWSHADAYARTDRLTNFGAGIYISYLFSLLWTLDVAWWLAPIRYTLRRPWIGWLLHSFMAFIIFNGSVVFAEGVVRWASLGMFLVLAGLLLRRLLRRQGGTPGFLQPRPIAGIPRET